jgi:hypothetical protein
MNAAAPRPRWYRLTPGRLIFGLLTAECMLWLSDRLEWPAWQKGHAVLSCIATFGAAILVMLIWWLIALVFRWRFQFSIRSLLVFGLAAALASSWFATQLDRARRQAKAIDVIKKGNGWVRYDVDEDPSSCWSNPVPKGPAQLRGPLGDDFFNDVVDARLANDAQKELLPDLPRLRRLYFTDDQYTHSVVGKLTDAGLERITELCSLQMLCLYGNSVTDDGLMQVGMMRQLSSLNLANTKITDAGLTHLIRLTELRELALGGTAVTDAGVKMIQQELPNCKIER